MNQKEPSCPFCDDPRNNTERAGWDQRGMIRWFCNTCSRYFNLNDLSHVYEKVPRDVNGFVGGSDY